MVKLPKNKMNRAFASASRGGWTKHFLVIAVAGCLAGLSALVIALTSQTITFAALGNKIYGDPPFTVSATASSGLPVSFASTTTTICTVSGSTVTIIAAGNCTIQASQAGNATYAAAPNVSRTFIVAKAAQTITFGALAGLRMDQAPAALSATASSGLVVAFTSTTTTICTVSGTSVTLKAVGTCTIQANQAGNANYLAATAVNQSFAITKGNQTITFGALANKTYKDPVFAVSATASSALAVTFSSLTTPVCTVSGANVTLVAAGSCTIRAAQAGNANWNAAANVDQPFAVAKASQTITFNALANKPLGTAPFAVSATASSTLAVAFASTTTAVCTVSGTTVTLVTMGLCTIQATQTGNANYLAATPVSQSFSVTASAQTITFGALPPRLWGSVPFAISATASSGLPVAFFSQTAVVCSVAGATVSLLSVGTCVIEAYQDGNGSYGPGYAARAFAVIKPIQFAPPVVYAQPGDPTAIALGDFNGDGKSDIVTNAPIAVFPGNGDGTLAARVAGPADINYLFVRRIVVADFNRDGKPDLAVLVDYPDGTGQVWVFLATGPNTFGAGTIVFTGPIYSIAVADFNNDGNPDLLIGGVYNVTPLLGDGAGGFRTGTPSVQNVYNKALAVADFNNDGKPDILSADPDSNQYCFATGKGDGTFNPALCAASVDGPKGIVVGDFNGDGNLDFGLMKSVPDANYVTWISIYLGKGNGTFFAPTDFAGLNFDVGPDVMLAAGDFNGDGRLDIAIGGSYTASVLTGAGDGTFFAPIDVFADNQGPSLVARDLNGDGRTDLVVGGQIGSTALSVLLAIDATSASATIVTQAGTPQTSPVNAPYPTLMSVLVRNSSNQPLPSQQVLFAAPNAGPSGTFSGGAASALVPTDSAGIALAPAFTANAIAGAFNVVAGIGGASTPFSLTNTATAQQAPAFVSGPPSDGSVGVPYSFLVVASGSPAPTISALANSLPTGLALSGGSGLISGTPSAAGTFAGNLTASNGVGANATQAFAIAIAQAVQTITFGPLPNRIFSTAPFTVSAAASSGLAITFTSTTTAICTVSGNTVTMVTVGTCTIRAAQAGNATYGAAVSVNQNTVISKASQIITFGTLADRSLGSGTFTVSATASSGLAVTFTSLTTATCTVAGTTVTLVAIGTCTLNVAQAGNATNTAASSVSQSFSVRPSGNQAPTVSFTVPTNNSTYVSPAIIPLLVNTADSDGNIVRVEFYNGATLIGSATSAPYHYVWTGVGTGTYSLTAKAFDNLGAVTASTSVSVTVAAPGAPLVFARRDTTLPTPITSFAAGDVNGDRKPDLALTMVCGDCQVHIYRGDGAGNFAPWSGVSPAINPSHGTVSVLADLNGDGRPDVVTSYPSSMIGVALANSDGTLRPSVGYSVSSATVGLTVGDFNGDGKLDVVVATFDGNIAFLAGNGDGTLQSAVYTVIGGYLSSIASGDFNGDGKLDLVVIDAIDGTIRSLRGNGDGTFQAPLTILTTTEPGDSPYRLLVGDFNGDGKLDIAFSNLYEPQVTVLIGNGDGTFQPPVDYPAGILPAGLALGDVDGDGKKDLVVANQYAAGTISVLLGNGNGTFRAPQSFATGTTPSNVAVLDISGDGKADILVDSTDPLLSVLLNTQGVTTSAPVITSGQPPAGTTGAPYTFQFTATGVPSPSFSITGLPSNFSVTSSGLLSGTQVSAWTYSGTVRATNGIAPDATQAFSFVVRDAGAPFTFTLPPYMVWDVGFFSGQLYLGDRISPANGQIGFESLTPTICSIHYTNGPDYVPGGVPYLWSEGIGVCTVRAYVTYATGGGVTALAIDRNINVIALPPMVTITAPADHTHYSAPASIAVTVDAQRYVGYNLGNNTGIPTVGVSIDGLAGCQASTAPYICTIANVAAGNHTLAASSFVKVVGGSVQFDSTPIMVHVQGAADLASSVITSPATSTLYFAPATIALQATASDPNSTISRVEFYSGPMIISTVNSPPYNFSWTPVPTGTYAVTARAVSASGVVTISAPITVVVVGDTATPIAFFDFNRIWDTTGFIKDSLGGYVLQSTGNITQVAAPVSGIKPDTCKAAAFAGGVLDMDAYNVDTSVGASTGVAFWMYWNGADGAMPFSWATSGLLLLGGNFGFTTTGSDVFGIASTGLANGWHHVFAEFGNGSVTGNRLYIDGVAKALTQRAGVPTLANAVVSAAWRLGGKYGSTTLPFAGQLDEVELVYGAVSPQQAATQAALAYPCGPVTVTLLAPATNASYLTPASIDFVAVATSQSGTISSIQFYEGSNYIGTGGANFSWRGVAAGTYVITATATDSLGGTATSAPVTVNVVEPVPHASISALSPGTTAYADGSMQFSAVPVMDPGYEIAEINIYIDGNVVLYTSLSNYVWEGKINTPGIHVITTEVIDKFGNKRRSAPLNINVLAGLPSLIYYYNDAAGTPHAATDQTGNLVWQQFYAPFGGRGTGDTGTVNGLWYTGKPTEDATGLSYLGARWYNATTGRFMGVDPAGFRESNRLSFNRYAYANNNPYRYLDPDGRSPASVVLWTIVRETGIGYGLGVVADSISQYAAWGSVDLQMAATSNAAVAGGEAGLVGGAVKGAARIYSTLRDAATAIIERTARQEASKGTDYLLNYLTPKEQAAYLANPDAGSRFLGQAVHRATAKAVQKSNPGRFSYSTRGTDFTDTTTGELVELTTPGGVAEHAARPYGQDIVTYTLP